MILLGLGTNLGHREANLQRALALLEEKVELIRVSSLVETPALLPENAPDEWNIPYLNLVCSCDSILKPLQLLNFVKDIEKQMGRVDVGRWGPRIIDIDIISYYDTTLDTEKLTIPHPSMTERAFVLRPLNEIHPEWVHPVIGKTAKELLG